MPDQASARRMVMAGYDAMAARHREWSGSSRVAGPWLRLLAGRLAPGSTVLDLGCGAGIPAAAALVARGHRVVGLDLSRSQLRLARASLPGADFVRADMLHGPVPPGAFDAVTACYSITHVPRSEHGRLFRSIAAWLKPGGHVLASLGWRDSADVVEEDWLGVPMFFSYFAADRNRELLEEAGFTVLREGARQQDNEAARFYWVLARRDQ